MSRRWGFALTALITAAVPLGPASLALGFAGAARAQQSPERFTPAQPAASLSLPAGYSDLYTLGPGDQLQLGFSDPSAKAVGGPVAILPDGTSTLALLGSVQLSGLTLAQATRWLISLYARHLLRPQLSLSLTTARPVQVSVLGEVRRPGHYSFGGGGAGSGQSTLAAGGTNAPASGLTTPVSAIQAAGGITLNADIHRVILRRPAGSAGVERQMVLDLARLLKIGDPSHTPILFDGDTLLVTRAERPLPSEVIQIGISNLAPATIDVTVLGEVTTPGTLVLPVNTPLQEALMRAGGPTYWRSNQGQIELVRLNRNGTSISEFYEYQPGQDIAKGFNPPLRDHDTIIVRRSLYGKSAVLLDQMMSLDGAIMTPFYIYSNHSPIR